MNTTSNNDISTERSKLGLQDEIAGIEHALAAIYKAQESGLDAASTEAVYRLRDEHGHLCEINNAGGFTFARGTDQVHAELIRFTPQETVHLWNFWRRLGYGEIGSMLRSIDREQTAEGVTPEASHE